MTNILKLSDHEAYSPKFSKMVARAQQENDGIPRYVEDQETIKRVIESERFKRDFADILGNGPEAA